MRETVVWEISWRSLWRIVFVAGVVALLLATSEAVGALLVAVVVGLGLRPFVDFFERRGISRLLGTLFIFVAALIAIGLVVYAIAPVVVVEFGGFAEHFSNTLTSIFGIQLPATTLSDVQTWVNGALDALSAAHISVTEAVGTLLSKVILVIAGVIVAFYLAIDREAVSNLLAVALPETHVTSALAVFHRFEKKIRHWVTAQLALSVIMGLVVGLGVWAFGVRYPLLIGLLAAVAELVPLVGPIITGAVTFLIAVSDSLALGISVLVFFIVVEQLEGHLLIPVVMGRTMEVHPVVVVIALLVGGQLAGLYGLILAVPAAVLIQEAFTYRAASRERPVTLDI